MRKWMPILEWLPTYQRSWLPNDLISGATVWAVLVPTGLAYSVLVGLDPVVGLYTIPLALVAYAVFGGSRLLVVGPDAAVAVLAGATVAAVVVGDNHLEIAIALSFMVAAVYVLFSLLKLGWIADLIPDPVLKGVLEGIVWLTILKQMSKLLGLKLYGDAEWFLPKVVELFQAVPQTHTLTAVIGFSSIVLMIGLHKFAPRSPGPLIVLVTSIFVVGFLGLGDQGVAVLGDTGGDSFKLALPTGLDMGQIFDLLPGALAIVLLGYTAGTAALKRVAEKTGERTDPDQEMLAFGMANLGAGLSGGYAITGTMSKTEIALMSGAKSQIGNLFTAFISVVTILFLLPFFASLADAALAALVIVVLAEISDIRYFITLWRVDRLEFVLGVAAFIGVLVYGVLSGVMIGVMLSLLVLADHIRRPTTAVVGRKPSGAYVDVDDHDDAQEIAGMLIWRQYAPLVFLNARNLSLRLRALVKERKDIRVVVLDATAASGIDTSAISAFTTAQDDLATAGVALWVVNVREVAWHRIVAKLEIAGKPIPPRLDSLADAVARFEEFGTAEPGSNG
jgi:high affinity sulfate transporter 1